MGSSTSAQWKEPSEKLTHMTQKKVTQPTLVAVQEAQENSINQNRIVICPVEYEKDTALTLSFLSICSI